MAGACNRHTGTNRSLESGQHAHLAEPLRVISEEHVLLWAGKMRQALGHRADALRHVVIGPPAYHTCSPLPCAAHHQEPHKAEVGVSRGEAAQVKDAQHRLLQCGLGGGEGMLLAHPVLRPARTQRRPPAVAPPGSLLPPFELAWPGGSFSSARSKRKVHRRWLSINGRSPARDKRANGAHDDRAGQKREAGPHSNAFHSPGRCLATRTMTTGRPLVSRCV